MKAALGFAGTEGFPYQLSPMKNTTALPILACISQKLHQA